MEICSPRGTKHQISFVWKIAMILSQNFAISRRHRADLMELEAGEALVNLRQKFGSGVKTCLVYREVIPEESSLWPEF